MSSKKHILFIVNPVSGGKSKKSFKSMVETHLNHEIYSYVIKETQYPDHAGELVRTHADQADAVIAVGGDGTINQTAKELCGTNTSLGIVPLGSGNGLARHLGIPLKPSKALQVLNTAVEEEIDTASLNGHFFLSVAGIGFDSLVAQIFSQTKGRGLLNYARATLHSFFQYQESDYTLCVDGHTLKRRAFMITAANSSQFGYNAKISPLASIQDGYLDVCILKKPSLWKSPVLLAQFFTGKAHTSSFLEIIRAKEISIAPNPSSCANIDGEPMQAGKKIDIRVTEKKLKMLLPNNHKQI